MKNRSSLKRPFLGIDDVAEVVSRASAAKRRIIDHVSYVAPADILLIVCSPFILIIERKALPDFRDVPPLDMEGISLSAGGASVRLEKHNIYVEAASLIAAAINYLREKNRGGLIMDLIEQNMKPPA